MKSAYELAMEKLAKKNPHLKTPSLTPAQKGKIVAIDNLYRAKIAEKELFLAPKIEKARMEEDLATLESLETQLHKETSTLRKEMENEKEKIRNAS